MQCMIFGPDTSVCGPGAMVFTMIAIAVSMFLGRMLLSKPPIERQTPAAAFRFRAQAC